MIQLNSIAIGVGICFFVSFYLIFDSLALAIALAISLGTALCIVDAEEKSAEQGAEKRKKVFPRHSAK